jgi:uncharacterized oxidoreductase
MDIVIEAGRLEALLAEIFEHAGCDREEAERIGFRLVGANLTGHDSHGVIRTSRYVDWLERGIFKAGQSIKVVFENDALAIVDGVYGFGQTVAEQACRLGIDKARKQGAAIIALKNAGHVGRVGDWAEMAVAEGLVSIHFVNARASVLVAPFGGSNPRISTAPFCAGVPNGEEDPFILDFATSVVAEGKVLVAAKGGKPLPEGALIDGDGNLSTDPVALYGTAGPDAPTFDRDGTGAIRAMGEHKGSGLALLCELLGGSLTGNAATGRDDQQFANGMLSIYLSPEVFDQDGGFAADVKRYIDYVKEARRADPDKAVLTPGDPERNMRAERLANGIPLPEETWKSIAGTAAKVGIDDDRIASISGHNRI